MKAFISIKFHLDQSNRGLIQEIAAALEANGFETICVARDLEKGGELRFTPHQLMQQTFEQIRACDVVVVDISEKGVGVGIEAGYAYALGKPVWVIARQRADIPETLRGIAAVVKIYEDEATLGQVCAELAGCRTF